MAAEILKDRFVLGNDFLSAAFCLGKGRLTSVALTHVLSGKTLRPAEGSDVFELRFAGALGGETVRAGELKVQDALPSESATGTVLKIFFKPFRVRGCKIELRYVAELGRTDTFLKVHLELRFSGGERAVADYIDLAPFAVRPEDKTGGVRLPEKKKDPCPSLLGQPVFWENGFFGCTFPGALNAVLNGRICARRYYGRSLQTLGGADGVFLSDCAVWGVAAIKNPLSVRAAFLRCLESILPPVQVQHVLRFSPPQTETDAVHALFDEDKRLQSEGVPFYDTVLLNKREVFPDDAPFSFSERCPQSLRTLGAAAASLGATLGLAVGLPEKSKKRFQRKDADVCLANEALLSSFSAFVLSLSKKCGVTDWQIHLPLEKPCREKTHGHAVGGERQIFYYSDLFEKWINLFCELKKTAGVPLRFSLCGAYSPWLLQWVDTLGLPLRAQTPSFDKRDSLYRALRSIGVCLPVDRLFFPAPQEVESFPYTAARRTLALLGAADPKALHRFRSLQSEFQGLLGHTAVPDLPEGEAGCIFAAFDSGEGLLVLHNPTADPREVTLALDETLGVPQRFLSVGVSELLPKTVCCSRTPLRFGDFLTRTLSPYETQVLHLGNRKAPPLLTSAAAKDAVTLHLRFEKPVDLTGAACAKNAVQSVLPDCDGFGAALRLAYPFAQKNDLTFSGVRDLYGNDLTVNASFMFAENGLLPLGALSGTGAFSVKVTFGSEENLQMYVQTERLLLAAEEGHITFKVGDTVLRSRCRTNDIVQICAVREESGTLKLYLNGKLEQSLLPRTAPCALVPAAPLCFDEKRIKLYARALAYDEV